MLFYALILNPFTSAHATVGNLLKALRGHMKERGSPERRRAPAKETERDVLPAPVATRGDHRLLLEAEGGLGFVLWQRARDVRLWASAPRPVPPHLFRAPSRKQKRYFAAALAEAPEIGDALSCLEGLVLAPGNADRAQIASACTQISEWAEGLNRFEIALTYAEAAAAALPSGAKEAARAGQLCVRVAADPFGPPMEVRAATWLHRATRLARRAKDWEWCIRSNIRLGLLMYALGDFERARRRYYRAGWMADWFGRQELAGKAHHDLLAIESHIGSYEKAEQQARTALALYPVRHVRLPYLVHDYAFCLVHNRYFKLAAELLDLVWPYIPEGNRLVINGTVARVSAALGNRARYESAASQVAILAELVEDGAAWSYIHLAEGARCFAEWDRAERYAGVALAIAQRRREHVEQRAAYALLDQITERAPSPRELEAPQSATKLAALCADRLGHVRHFRPQDVPTSHVVATGWAP